MFLVAAESFLVPAVAVIADDGDRGASERLRGRLDEALGELDRHDYSSRCGGR